MSSPFLSTNRLARRRWTSGRLFDSPVTHSAEWRETSTSAWTPSGLAMLADAHLAAVLENRTNRAFRKATRAHMLPEGNQQPVYLHPVFFGQALLQNAPRCFGRWSPYESPAVGHTI